MEWSRPKQQGEIPSPRAGHAGVTVGENWFIVGGGDNTTGMYLRTWYSGETLVCGIFLSQ